VFQTSRQEPSEAKAKAIRGDLFFSKKEQCQHGEYNNTINPAQKNHISTRIELIIAPMNIYFEKL
jgi:hypothetical protein